MELTDSLMFCVEFKAFFPSLCSILDLYKKCYTSNILVKENTLFIIFRFKLNLHFK